MHMSKLTTDGLRILCSDETIMLTQHLSLRMRERGIRYEEIKSAILGGDIIEQYPDDHPYPSCLVLHSMQKPLHVVCGVGDSLIWVITAYYPDPSQWESDCKTRKEKKDELLFM
jgi:hypothetical protein